LGALYGEAFRAVAVSWCGDQAVNTARIPIPLLDPTFDEKYVFDLGVHRAKQLAVSQNYTRRVFKHNG
jgi:hypothetical protein